MNRRLGREELRALLAGAVVVLEEARRSAAIVNGNAVISDNELGNILIHVSTDLETLANRLTKSES